ncbi:Aste57867_13006 [Aphanomyces stellatus]|uniref:Aste57867_13006 protein n=1 Tax=Aphanomyces stellatus TaxID=120398 RepID=A0A485KXH8_9STRA|nr:hypothetical protein As57867_012958 [Aphanomyces stellatus]VFT89852.1 Aste57867_13006 [Aphanomyces stellatus]
MPTYQKPTTSKQLHFDAKCDKNAVSKDEFAHFCILNSTTDTTVKALVGDLAIDKIVFWRVRQSLTGEWQEFSAKKTSSFKFHARQTTFWFEAYTACGQVATKSWDIYVHRTEILNSGDWFKSLWKIAATKCNVEGTDFGAATFLFDPTAAELKTLLNPPNAIDLMVAALLGSSDGNNDVAAATESASADDLDCDPSSIIRFAKCGPRERGCRISKAQVTCETRSFNIVFQDPPAKKSILRDFHGFDCTWQYDGASVTTWLTTDKADTQVALTKDIEIKLLNKDVTKATASCKLKFVNQNTKTEYSQTKEYPVFLQTCDTPRWNVGTPFDHGKYIADICTNTWDVAAASRKPAPFQACAGPTLFPDKADSITTYLEPSSPLECCNKDSAYQCRHLTKDDKTSTGFCSENMLLKPVIDNNVLLNAVAAFAVSANASASITHLGGVSVAVFAAVAIVVAIVRRREEKARAAGESDDMYIALIN